MTDQIESDARTQMLAALKAACITRVEITYDGSSDEGQIDTIRAYDAINNDVALDALPPPGSTDPPTDSANLHESIADFAWNIIMSRHSGFQDNEGGYGEITIDVADGSITLDHNQRYYESWQTVTEV